MNRLLPLLLAATMAGSAASLHAQSLIRNGSFEGSGKYWLREGGWWTDEHEGPGRMRIVEDATAPDGQYVLLLKDAAIRTPAFLVEPGTRLEIRCHARADAADTALNLSFSPSLDDRRQGTPPFGTRGQGTGFPAKVGTQWQRVSWTIDIPDAKWKWSGPGAGFNWDHKTWFLILRPAKGHEVRIDAVSVVDAGKPLAGEWLLAPYSPVEVLHTTDAVSLTGYRTTANILEKGRDVALRTFLINNQAQALEVTLRLELLNYDGSQTFQSQDVKASLPPHRTQAVDSTVKLTGNGLMLARATVLDAAGAVLGQSDQPLTVLAFPKNATAPNMNERIGGTVANGGKNRTPHLEDVAQRIGLAWTRWYPYTDWNRVQVNGPDDWQWPDEHVNNLNARGIAVNGVWYKCPAWAAAPGSKYIPKDMADWTEKDPRWDDLSIQTLWDRYLSEAMKHYAGKAVVWELVNEPEFSGGTAAGGGEVGAAGSRRWDAKFYTNFVRRSYKRIKSIDPKAVVLISGVNGGIDPLTRQFLALGGAPYCDVYSYHTYTPGNVSSPQRIREMYDTFRKAGAPQDFSLWFNEGWTTYPSSQDDPAPLLHGDRHAADVADMVTRSISECFAAGLQKMIFFNIAYPKFGRSSWDWSGDGTEWYDDDANPTVAVGTYNVMIDQIGLSREHKSLQLRTVGGGNAGGSSGGSSGGATAHIFQDDRHHRGVIVLWSNPAQPPAKAWLTSRQPGAAVALPLVDLVAIDLMGNPVDLKSAGGTTTIAFPRAGKPYYVHSARGLSAEELSKALEPAQP